MNCIVCEISTKRNERLVCDECLKPLCRKCYAKLTTKLCPNCLNSISHLESINEIIEIYKRNINPLCYNKKAGQCSGGFSIVKNGGRQVISCLSHQFICIDCDNSFSIAMMLGCDECSEPMCHNCTLLFYRGSHIVCKNCHK